MTQPIAIVTGGSRGLGKNAVLKLAASGIGIILTYNTNHAEAQKVVEEIEQKGGKGTALALNVCDISQFDDFVSQVQERLQTVWQRDSVDYLVNNAGTGIQAAFAETREAQFDEMVNIHFKGPFFLVL